MSIEKLSLCCKSKFSQDFLDPFHLYPREQSLRLHFQQVFCCETNTKPTVECQSKFASPSDINYRWWFRRLAMLCRKPQKWGKQLFRLRPSSLIPVDACQVVHTGHGVWMLRPEDCLPRFDHLHFQLFRLRPSSLIPNGRCQPRHTIEHLLIIVFYRFSFLLKHLFK